MKRRDLLGLLGGAAVAWPLGARAQSSPTPAIGFINTGSPYEWAPFVAAFRDGLSDMGYVEGHSVTIEFRWEFGQLDRSPSFVQDLIERHVDILVTGGGNHPTLAAKRATSTIPIVATFGDDPVKRGIVTTLDRPGGNVTGVSLISDGLESKQFTLLRELVPSATTAALLVDSGPGVVDIPKYQEAARSVGQQILILSVASAAEIDGAFATAKQKGAGAMLVASTAYFLGVRTHLAACAARYAVPTLYPARPYVDGGGLVSYGVDRRDAYHQLGMLTGRILNGETTPAETPVRRSSKFELAINLKTAKDLNLAVPQSMITLADAVIQ